MDDSLERRWIILLREGQIPGVKRPVNTCQVKWNMLKDIYCLDPAVKALCVVMTWDGKLWVVDGKEELKHMEESNDLSS